MYSPEFPRFRSLYAAYEHIEIVEAVVPAILQLIELTYGDIPRADEIIVDVAGGAEHMSAGGAYPMVYLLGAPVAGGKEDIPSGRLECHRHSVVKKLHRNTLRLPAVVVLKKVHADISEHAGVGEFVIEAARIAGAGM